MTVKIILKGKPLLVGLCFLVPILTAQDIRPEKSRIISGLQSLDMGDRARTLHLINQDYAALPEISEMLIRLLEHEMAYYGTGLTADKARNDGDLEAFGEYYWKLIQTIGKTGDPAAIPALIECIYHDGGRDVADALGSFGDAGMTALMDELDKYEGIERVFVHLIITVRFSMAGIQKSAALLSQATRLRIKSKMLDLSSNLSVLAPMRAIRIDAVTILGHFPDPDVIAHLEYLALSDPYYMDYPTRTKKRIQGYPIREEAQKQLRKIKGN